MAKTIGIIGCGNMGSALAENLARVIGPERLVIFDKDGQKQEALLKGFKVCVAGSLRDLVAKSDAIVIAVKPQDVEPVLDFLKEARGKLVISLAAGLALAYFAHRLGPETALARAMPNLNAMVGASMTGICFGSSAVSSDHKDMTRMIFESVGNIVFIEEGLMNVFTAIAGSGPAFIAFVTDVLSDHQIKDVFVKEAVNSGFQRSDAEFIAEKTIEGTRKILRVNFDRDIFIKKVCSKGGTTEAGMKVLEGFGKTPQGLSAAIRAAGRRAVELSRSV